MLINSNYTSKLGPTIKENWLVQIFKNNNSNNMVNDTPDLALCFATASGSTTATLKNSSNTEIPYYPVIVNKPTIRSSVDLKGFSTQTGSITLNLADTDIVIGDSKKRLLEEFGSSYQNAQVNVLSVIDDDTTNANALQIFSGKISSFSYRNNTIILSVISSRPFQGTSIPNTKTSGVIDGLDIPYVLGSFDPNTGALDTAQTNVYPVPFLRNDGSHLLFTLPDKISSGTTTDALEYYDTGMQRFVPIQMTTAEKTAVTKDGSSTIKAPIDMVRTFTTLPDDLQDEAGNSNDAYVDSEGNFLGYNNNIDKAFDGSASTQATITGSLNPLQGDSDSEAGLSFYVKLPTPQGKITDLKITTNFTYTLNTLDESQSGLHVYINDTLSGNNANISGAVNILGTNTNPDQTTSGSVNATFNLFSDVVTDNQLPETLVLTFKMKAGTLQGGGNEDVQMTLNFKDVNFQITATNDTTDEPIASSTFNAGINKLYLGTDIVTPTFNQHANADDNTNNPVSIHRELLKGLLSIDSTDDTEINDSGYVSVSDLRSSESSVGQWDTRLILNKPTALESLLRKLQYEGCFFFEFSPQEKQVGTGPSGLSRFRYFTIPDNPGVDVQVSQNDLQNYSLAVTNTDDLETNLKVNYDRHPAESRYLKSDTFTATEHTNIFENADHQKQEFNLDLLKGRVDNDTSNTGRNASWINFRKSIFGQYRTIVTTRIINPEKYGTLTTGSVISFGDITFSTLGSPFNEISDTFDSFVAMPTRLFDSAFANKKYFITSLTRGMGYVEVTAQEVQ